AVAGSDGLVPIQLEIAGDQAQQLWVVVGNHDEGLAYGHRLCPRFLCVFHQFGCLRARLRCVSAREGEEYMELATSTGETLRPDDAVMKLDNALAESEAESHAVSLASELGINPMEVCEDAAELFCGDTDAGVANDNLQHWIGTLRITWRGG